MSSTTRGVRDDHDLGRVVNSAVRGALNYRGSLDDSAALGRALSASYVVQRDEPWLGPDGAARRLARRDAPWTRTGLDGGPRAGGLGGTRVHFVPSASAGAALGGPGVPVGPVARYRGEAQQVRGHVTALLESLRLDTTCSGAAGELVPSLARQIRTALDGLVAEAGRVPASRARMRAAVEVLVGRDGAGGLAAELSAAVQDASHDLSDLSRLALRDVERQVADALGRLQNAFPENGLGSDAEEYYGEIQPQLTLLLEAAAGDVADLRRLLADHGFDNAAARLLALSTADEDIALADALDWLEDLAGHSGPAAVQAGPVVVMRELEPAVTLLEQALASLEKVDECPFDDEDVACVVTRLCRRVRCLGDALPVGYAGGRNHRRDYRQQEARDGHESDGDQKVFRVEEVLVDSGVPEQSAPPEATVGLWLIVETPEGDRHPPLLRVRGTGTVDAPEKPGQGPVDEDELDGRRRLFYLVPVADPEEGIGLELHDERGVLLKVERVVPSLTPRLMLSAVRPESPAAS